MGKIEYPIEVSKIEFGNLDPYNPRGCGTYVAVRPCNEKFGNKTYLGVYLGEISLGPCCYHNKETKVLRVPQHMNPAIYIPDCKEVVFGCGSWWHKIKNPEDLKQISDQDIDNVWYVKALRELQSIEESSHTKNVKNLDDE